MMYLLFIIAVCLIITIIFLHERKKILRAQNLIKDGIPPTVALETLTYAKKLLDKKKNESR